MIFIIVKSKTKSVILRYEDFSWSIEFENDSAFIMARNNTYSYYMATYNKEDTETIFKDFDNLFEAFKNKKEYYEM